MRGPDGSITGAVAVIRDITEQKRAEEALRESELRLRTLSDNLPEAAIYSYRHDAAGQAHVDFITAGIERMTGVPALEYMHDPATVERNILPEDRDRLHAGIALSRESLGQFEIELRHPNRATREMRWSLLRATPIRFPDGSTVWNGIELDITGRKRAEEALQRSEAMYRAIASGLPDGMVCAVDAEMRCIALEGGLARRWGMESEKFEGRPVLDAVDQGLRPQVEAYFRSALAGERASYESEVRGTAIWSQYTPLRDKSGKLVGAMMVAFDISERKRAEERLRQTQKLESIGLLAGGIAHDFNNLLTGLMGNASLLLEDAPPERAELLRSIIAGTERAAHLTRQLLAYSGKGQFIVRELDVTQAVNEMADLVQFSIPKSAELRLDLQRRLPPVAMDPGQLQQILMNLVINAGEAIGEGHPGRIAVSTSVVDIGCPFTDDIGEDIAPGRYVRIEVRDTGSGIDPEKKSKIFDPFFTTKFVGRGLGLAAIAGILRAQKGGITVESTPGHGTTFRVFLPAAGKGAAAVQDSASAGGRASILVVDDEVSVRDFIGAVLRRKGYHVIQASDGQEALSLCGFAPGAISAAIVDIIMPNMAANELLPALKAMRPGMRILLTSGYSEAEARRLCVAYPGAAFIQKPYTAQQLAKAVGDLLVET